MDEIKGFKALCTKLFTPSNLAEARRDPFQFIDDLTIVLHKHDLNALKLDVDLRKVMLRMSVVVTVIWALAGWDSTAGQVQALAQEFGMQLLRLRLDWQALITAYMSDYGKNTHWSAFSIYGFMYYFLSRYYSSIGITRSRNFVLSFGFTFLSIGAFEFAWQYCYAYGQQQFWVITWAWPQLRILIQCLIFTALGIFVLIMLVLEHSKTWHSQEPRYFSVYNLNLDNWTILLGVGTLATFILWYYYPWPISYITVPRDFSAPWTNTNYFPQTLYTVQESLSMNAGVQFYVPNDLLHGVNNLAKVLMTAFFYSLGKLRLIKP